MDSPDLISGQNAFFLELYDIAYSASGFEVFNQLAQKICKYFCATASSIWIRDNRVQHSEGRLGFYESYPTKGLGQRDYQEASSNLFKPKEYLEHVIEIEGRQWFLYIDNFAGTNVTGCYCLWFDQLPIKEFKAIREKLAFRLANIVDRQLTCSRFECKRIIQELTTAEKLQTLLLPTKAPVVQGVSIGYRSLMVNEVGGDYLDLFSLGEKRVGMVVGDAMGKGIPAAFSILTTRSIFRFLARTNLGPNVILNQVNSCLAPELIEQNMFITMFYGIYDSEEAVLNYAVAGHNPPVLFRKRTRDYITLPGRGAVIGGLVTTNYQIFKFSLCKGDILVIYSDGVVEAKNEEQRNFGIEGIGEFLKKYAEYDAEAISDCLSLKLMKHSSNRPKDDVSFIVLKIN